MKLIFCGGANVERVGYEISENVTQRAAFDISRHIAAARCNITYVRMAHSPSLPTEKNLSNPIPASTTGWKAGIYEFRHGVRLGALRHYSSKGYKDTKYVLWGDVNSGPITFKISVKRGQGGFIFVCEPPGVGRDKAIEFDKLFDVHLTPLDAAAMALGRNITVLLDSSSKREYHHNARIEICWQLTEPVVKGDHLLTYVPTTTHMVMIAYLLVP